MCKKFLILSAFCAVFALLFAGCAAPPRWAQEDSPTIRDVQDKYLAGVGKAHAALGDQKVLQAAASLRARTNLRKARGEYAADFMEQFIDENQEAFDLDKAEGYMTNFKEHFQAQTLLRGEIDQRWIDERGELNGEGTVYAMARLTLDPVYFEVLQKSAAETLEKHREVLTVDMSEILDKLNEKIQFAIQYPFEALKTPEEAPAPIEEEKEGADDEMETEEDDSSEEIEDEDQTEELEEETEDQEVNESTD